MAIQVQRVGHVVLKVRSLARSVPFYRDVLGLSEVARWRQMAFFAVSGQHHDLALLEVGEGAPAAERDAVGLYHVAFKIGDDLAALRAAKAHLDGQGARILAIRDHTVSQSIYLNDPDGNGLELYVDADPAIWRENPASVGASAPLEL